MSDNLKGEKRRGMWEIVDKNLIQSRSWIIKQISGIYVVEKIKTQRFT